MLEGDVPEPRLHDPSRQSRAQAGDHRDDSASRRDTTAARRDADAEVRDQRADARDSRAHVRELERDGLDPDANFDRWESLRDRRSAAGDRVAAANDRLLAQNDRVAASRDRDTSSIDELTGAYRRDAGIVELARDLEAAKRTGQSMVLGFLDVDGLKAVNDRHGHAAGDDLLRQVTKTVRAFLRQFDLIVRYGGDEFLFSAVGLSLPEAVGRMHGVDAALLLSDKASITVGMAQAQAGEILTEVIDRADAELYRRRELKRVGAITSQT
jgi:diguanylate cyclase (GGDEF)-like protein